LKVNLSSIIRLYCCPHIFYKFKVRIRTLIAIQDTPRKRHYRKVKSTHWSKPGSLRELQSSLRL